MDKVGKFGFQLKITKSVYFQDGQEFSVEIPFLNFENNGNVSLDGQDSIGSFTFSGKIEGDHLFLKKAYHGAHTVFYCGKLEKNMLNLVYDFEGNYQMLLQKVNSGQYMALIEFEANLFNLYLDDNHEIDYNVFLVYDENKNKYKGLGLIKNKLTKIIMKKKECNYAKLKLKNDEGERSIRVTIDNSNNNIYLERNSSTGNYALRIFKFAYLMEGLEYNTYLPHLFFRDNGHCSNEITDNNGYCEFKGHFENDIFFLEKTYPGKLSVYFAGKMNNNRLNLAYDFTPDFNTLRSKVINNQTNAFFELEHKSFNMVLNPEDGKVHLALLKQGDGNKLKGFSVVDNKLNIIVFKRKKEGKKAKLKIKTSSKVMYIRAKFDENSNNIIKKKNKD